MKQTLRYLAVVAFIMAVAIGSFILGAKTNIATVNAEITNTQAMQWFNHLLRFRELESDLSKGCASEALEKVKISIAEEMRLLSSFYKEHNNTWVNKYISDRDPTLLANLEAYQSPYGNSFTEPQCAK